MPTQEGVGSYQPARTQGAGRSLSERAEQAGVTAVGCEYERDERSHIGHAGDEIDQAVLEGLGLCMLRR